MKKNAKIIINCSTEHKQILKVRAQDNGVSLGSYCLFCALNSRPKTEQVDFSKKRF